MNCFDAMYFSTKFWYIGKDVFHQPTQFGGADSSYAHSRGWRGSNREWVAGHYVSLPDDNEYPGGMIDPVTGEVIETVVRVNTIWVEGYWTGVDPQASGGGVSFNHGGQGRPQNTTQNPVDVSELGDPPPPPEELVHCNKDVQEKIKEISGISNRGRGGGGIKQEAGFRVDPGRLGGYKPGPTITGQYSMEVNVPLIRNVTVAKFHTHPGFNNVPSGPDIAHADQYHYVVYVLSGLGLYLYNPRNPKDASGKDRIIKAPKC